MQKQSIKLIMRVKKHLTEPKLRMVVKEITPHDIRNKITKN